MTFTPRSPWFMLDKIQQYGNHICRVRIYRPRPDQVIVIATQLQVVGEDTRYSLHSMDELATLLRAEHFPAISDIIWYFHHPYYYPPVESAPDKDLDWFLQMDLEWTDLICKRCMQWKAVTTTEVESVIGEEIGETSPGFIPGTDRLYTERKIRFQFAEEYEIYKLLTMLLLKLNNVQGDQDLTSVRNLIYVARAILVSLKMDHDDPEDLTSWLSSTFDTILHRYGLEVYPLQE